MEKGILGKDNWVIDTFKSFEESLNGEKASPIHAIRKQALTRFSELGFPTTRNEEWKYTDTSPIVSRPFKLNVDNDGAALNQEVIDSCLLKECSQSALVFLDGVFSPILSRWDIPGDKLEFLPLAKYFSQSSPAFKLEEVVSNFPAEGINAFTALSTAFLRDGIALRVGKSSSISAPIQLIFVATAGSSRTLITPRVSIVAEQGSSIEVVETHICDRAESYLSSSVTEISVGQNASVKYQRIEFDALSAFHVANVRVKQERDSRFSSNFVSFGGKLVRNEVVITLNGSGCHTGINGLTVLKEDQHVDNHTTLDHAEPHCESVERFKGVYSDRSRGVFQGTIVVRPDAQKTNAIQSNQSILLSKDATIDTKPQLKIWADDVKCTHGATVGQLDENALFYIRSRGIDSKTARNMLVHAFASDILSGISIESLRELLERELLKKLEDN